MICACDQKFGILKSMFGTPYKRYTTQLRYCASLSIFKTWNLINQVIKAIKAIKASLCMPIRWFHEWQDLMTMKKANRDDRDLRVRYTNQIVKGCSQTYVKL